MTNTNNSRHMNHEQDLQDGTETSGASGRYIHIAPKSHPMRGKLIELVGPDDPAAVKRTYMTKALEGKPSEEKTVYEKAHASITGSIEGLYVRTRQRDFGRGLEDKHSVALVLSVSGERLIIEVEQDSRHWAPFFMALPNLDVNRKVKVETYDYDRKSDGKRVAGITFRQAAIGKIPEGAEVNPQDNTYQVPWFWTKDNPGKLPPAVRFEHPKTKEIEWYFDDRDTYLREVVAPAIAERIAKKHEVSMSNAESSAPEPAPAPKPTALDAAAQHAQSKAVQAPAITHDAFPVPDVDDDLPF